VRVGVGIEWEIGHCGRCAIIMMEVMEVMEDKEVAKTGIERTETVQLE
jgi:hypothetical protein